MTSREQRDAESRDRLDAALKALEEESLWTYKPAHVMAAEARAKAREDGVDSTWGALTREERAALSPRQAGEMHGSYLAEIEEELR